ncbi:MAG: hypothetical protein ABSD20_19455 [Terriglobales bacterium]
MYLPFNHKAPIADYKVLLPACALLLFCQCMAFAQKSREPLTDAEIDELREVAQQPEKRIPLYVKYLKARSDKLDRLFDDPRYQADRISQIRELLQDIDSLVQEMDDNLDTYARGREDLRKPLKDVISLDRNLQTSLHGIQKKSDTPEGKQYAFLLRNALESVDDSLANAQKLRQEQEEVFKNEKKK